MSTDKETVSSALKAPDLCERRVLFGSDLKNLRMRHNLSLNEVAEKTRINMEYIEALENGMFEKLPGRLFGRGFLAALLKNYGGSEINLIAAYEELWLDDGIQNSISDTTKRRLGENSAASVFTYMTTGKTNVSMRLVLGTIVVLSVLGTAFVGYKKGGHYFSTFLKDKKKVVQPAELPEEPKAAVSAPAGKSSAQLDADEDSQNLANEKSDELENSQRTKIISSGNAGQQILSITVLEPVKMKIESDDGRPVIKEFGEGVYNYNFSSTADLLIYDAAAVKISFNGNSLGALGTKGRVRRIGFRAEAPDQKSF